MSQPSVRQAARRSALAGQAVRRKERADWERRLEGFGVIVLTEIGERDGVIRDAECPPARRADDDRRRGPAAARGGRVVR